MMSLEDLIGKSSILRKEISDNLDNDVPPIIPLQFVERCYNIVKDKLEEQMNVIPGPNKPEDSYTTLSLRVAARLMNDALGFTDDKIKSLDDVPILIQRFLAEHYASTSPDIVCVNLIEKQNAIDEFSYDMECSHIQPSSSGSHSTKRIGKREKIAHISYLCSTRDLRDSIKQFYKNKPHSTSWKKEVKQTRVQISNLKSRNLQTALKRAAPHPYKPVNLCFEIDGKRAISLPVEFLMDSQEFVCIYKRISSSQRDNSSHPLSPTLLLESDSRIRFHFLGSPIENGENGMTKCMIKDQIESWRKLWDIEASKWLKCPAKVNPYCSWEWEFDEVKKEFDAIAERKYAGEEEDYIDIVYYIGHAEFDDYRGGYFFWGEDSYDFAKFAELIGAGRIRPDFRYADKARQRLTHLNFVFLSCCEGAAAEGKSLEEEDDLIYRRENVGIMEWLVCGCEAPSVVGFRWKVEMEAAVLFAEDFYKTMIMFKEPLPVVLWRTREQIREFKNPRSDDPTWAAAVMVH